MRRFALPLLVFAMIAAAPLARAEAPSTGTVGSGLSVPCDLEAAGDATPLRLDWRKGRGGVQLACSQGCLRRCAAVYRRCLARSRDWRRCSAVRRNCIRSCGC